MSIYQEYVFTNVKARRNFSYRPGVCISGTVKLSPPTPHAPKKPPSFCTDLAAQQPRISSKTAIYVLRGRFEPSVHSPFTISLNLTCHAQCCGRVRPKLTHCLTLLVQRSNYRGLSLGSYWLSCLRWVMEHSKSSVTCMDAWNVQPRPFYLHVVRLLAVCL